MKGITPEQEAKLRKLFGVSYSNYSKPKPPPQPKPQAAQPPPPPPPIPSAPAVSKAPPPPPELPKPQEQPVPQAPLVPTVPPPQPSPSSVLQTSEKPPHKKKALPKIKNPFSHSVFKKKKVMIPAVLGITMLVSGGLIYLWQTQNPAIIYAKKVHDITSVAGKYTALPKNEDPVIATVTDKKVLPHQEFFKYAENGDKILMYKMNKKAVLFRPSTQQVIAVATLDFRDSNNPSVAQQAVAGASTSAQPTSVVSASPAPTSAITMPTPQGKVLIQPNH